MKKIRKNTQLSLINLKRAGRKPIHDKGIRHIKRERIIKDTSLHITIKVRENKADIQNKKVLKALHQAIKRARAKSLKLIHYTLEYNHIHILVEIDNHQILGKAMQAFGISLAKNINKVKALKGAVYKHRYHLRKITTPTELRNVLHYIFSNGVKHKRTYSILDKYNSAIAERQLKLLYPKLALKPFPNLFHLQMELFKLLDPGRIHFKALEIRLS
jgi:REP element-mobilizing transposase RayT